MCGRGRYGVFRTRGGPGFQCGPQMLTFNQPGRGPIFEKIGGRNRMRRPDGRRCRGAVRPGACCPAGGTRRAGRCSTGSQRGEVEHRGNHALAAGNRIRAERHVRGPAGRLAGPGYALCPAGKRNPAPRPVPGNAVPRPVTPRRPTIACGAGAAAIPGQKGAGTCHAVPDVPPSRGGVAVAGRCGRCTGPSRAKPVRSAKDIRGQPPSGGDGPGGPGSPVRPDASGRTVSARAFLMDMA